MYSTCTFCNRPLGANEAIEHFPVGRRLAFDADKGRLWVICRACAGWNLTPLEERWEAIEEAERLYRDTRLRVSTDNIGLARLRDGTDLVRIGSPQRPEMAAWRYGEQFVQRRRRHLITAGFIAGGGVAAVAGGMAAGLGIIAMWNVGKLAFHFADKGFPESVVARVKDRRGHLVKVKRKDLLKTTIVAGADGGLALNVQSGDTMVPVRGEEARRIAKVLFRAVNLRGGSTDDVENAVGRLARAGSAEQFLEDAARRGQKLSRVSEMKTWKERSAVDDMWSSGLLALSTPLSLAIEMALHEEQERRALEGELAELERSWQEAEEIGAIADSLLLPAGLDRVLQRLREGN